MTTIQTILVLAGFVTLVVVVLCVLRAVAVRERQREDARINGKMVEDLTRVWDESLNTAKARGLQNNEACFEAWRATIARMCEWQTEILVRRMSNNGTATGRYARERIEPIIKRGFITARIAADSMAKACFDNGATSMSDVSPFIEKAMEYVLQEALKEI